MKKYLMKLKTNINKIDDKFNNFVEEATYYISIRDDVEKDIDEFRYNIRREAERKFPITDDSNIDLVMCQTTKRRKFKRSAIRWYKRYHRIVSTYDIVVTILILVFTMAFMLLSMYMDYVDYTYMH